MSLDEHLDKIGEGRSSEVYKGEDSQGKPIARKIFTGGLITKLANYFFLGAPNAYIWNEHAIQTAYYRRKLLSELVDYWFSQKLRVAKAVAVKWNDEFKAYELQTELINGRHASLHHPFSQQREAELSDLVNNIMKPLQEKLIEAGFDGLVWQAGKGIPNASSNFMLENNGYNENRWVWVDLESAVPAMLPLNIFTLFSFYLPKSIKHRRPLFDDVDIKKLSYYAVINKEDLERKLGSERYSSLLDNIKYLDSHQKAWKSMKRAHRSITYQLKKEKINQEQADWYYKHPYIWYGREIGRISLEVANKLVVELPRDIYNKLISIDYKKILSNTWKFVSSEKYRIEVARNYIQHRIDEWEQRNQLRPEEANFLSGKLETEVTTPYLTDLYVHGLLKIFDWFILPTALTTLYAYGMIGLKEAGAIGFLGGSIMRTTYTAGRMTYIAIRPNIKNMPRIKEYLIALGVGAIPQLGNAAYPVQMIYSSSIVDREIGKFMIYHLFSKRGEKFPLYGGRDTRTEHFFNHIPDIIVRNRKDLNLHN